MNRKKRTPEKGFRSFFNEGLKLVSDHPMFHELVYKANFSPQGDTQNYPKNWLCTVDSFGTVYYNSKIKAEPAVWARAIAHCMLHLGMSHIKETPRSRDWNIACDCAVERFLSDLKFGSRPNGLEPASDTQDENKLYERLEFMSLEEKKGYLGFGTAGDSADMIFREVPDTKYQPKWTALFAAGLRRSVEEAVAAASGESNAKRANSKYEQTRAWFISSYPLLGAVASRFHIIEDPLICIREHISIAAVNPSLAEIYFNPAANLDSEEIKFVMAHEFLHAALRHGERCEWRDPYLWNVACDFVINHWLNEMGVGERPEGVLYDEQFSGLNAEAVYDVIRTDLRTYRKLATLRGVGLGDILGKPGGAKFDTDLDEFYRRALSQGLHYHNEQGRGYLPAGLVEEIRALSVPPIPWDVELARWFDEYFTPLEKRRTYAQISRRQSASPDIPRPNLAPYEISADGRTFGVLLDTSGSMDRHLLASALGAIASYAMSRDVPAARVVFCDASAYDMGYMRPEDIAGTVKVRGRGGTILQPGIDILDDADDFPREAPLLIITDGMCDKVILHGRDHAFLIPTGASLPFVPKGKVFRLR